MKRKQFKAELLSGHKDMPFDPIGVWGIEAALARTTRSRGAREVEWIVIRELHRTAPEKILYDR